MALPRQREGWLASAGTPRHRLELGDRYQLTCTPTLELLARDPGVSPSGLEATVARFNSDAALGVDTEFGRGSTPQDRFLGDAGNTPNPCLAPLLRAPFSAEVAAHRETLNARRRDVIASGRSAP
nr:FAD-binding protein [Paenarthrobacter sp. A20]